MIETFSIPMVAREQDRTIRVHLPEGYAQSEQRYPVLYMHDGQFVFRDEDSPEGVSLGLEEYLNRTGRQVIVVAIDNNPSKAERVNEYCPWPTGEYAVKILGEPSPLGGKGAAYAEFLVRELMPLIESKYRTDKQQSYLAGASIGSLISVYIVCRYPGLFKGLAGFSSGFYRNQEEIERLLKTADLSSLEKVYLDCGTQEAGDEVELNGEVIAFNRSVYEIIADKVEHTKFAVVEKARHKYPFFRERVPAMMDFLFGPSGQL